MIASIAGTVKAIGVNAVIIDVAGIGYKVHVPAVQLLKYKGGEAVEVFVYDQVREDSRELFGFQTFEELELAEQLLTVSGVGPKIAQALVQIGVEKVRDAIRKGDVDVFLSISGIGKKRAQQIVLELKGSIDLQAQEKGRADEVAYALEELGYGAKEISAAMAKVPQSGTTEDRLRIALSMLAKSK